MAMAAMGLVLAYLLVTAPMLLLMLKVHSLGSDYTRLFMIAMFLQLIPIGLIFLPLGVVGLGLLAVTLAATILRNRKFRRGNFDNTEVHRRWTFEAIANFAAFGLALEQKGIAVTFLEVVSQRATPAIWLWLGLGSLGVWGVLGWCIWREWCIMRGIVNTTLG